MDHSGLKKYIEDFYELLDPNILKSNHDPDKVFELTENGYERHYLSIVANGKVHGLACVNYDHTSLGSHRCFIRHLSTIIPNALQKGLDAIVNYIFLP